MINKNHYTYIIKHSDTNEFYFGSRSCKCKIEDDDYMGSMISWKPNKNKLTKTILNTNFNTREEAIKEEINLIKENINHKLNRNYNIPGLGFHNTNKTFSLETRKKMSIARLGELNPMYDNTHSTKTKEKIRTKALGRKMTLETREKMSNSHYKKKVIQFDKNMNLIAEFNSIKEAGIKTNTDKGDISKVCNNKQKTAGGYIWKEKL